MSEETADQLFDRINQLHKDISEVLALQLPRDPGLGEAQYGAMYNALLAEAEKLTKVKPLLSNAPGRGDAGSSIGVLIALKGLTGQLAHWLRAHTGMPRMGQPLR